MGSRAVLEQAGFSVEVRNLGKQSVGYEYHIIARSGEFQKPIEAFATFATFASSDAHDLEPFYKAILDAAEKERG